MRIGQFGSDVELEVIMIWYDGITQFNDSTTSLLECL